MIVKCYAYTLSPQATDVIAIAIDISVTIILFFIPDYLFGLNINSNVILL